MEFSFKSKFIFLSILLILLFLFGNVFKLAAQPDISKIFIPEEYGTITESFQGLHKELIICIQDLHCNYDAQSNAALIMKRLIDKLNLNLIAVEGSCGLIDTSKFSSFPDEEIKQEVANYFLKKGRINCAEYLSITTKSPLLLYGIEDEDLYLAHMANYRRAFAFREKALKHCQTAEKILANLKEQLYTEDLKELDRNIKLAKEDKSLLVKYIQYLWDLAIKNEIQLERFQNLSILYQRSIIEQKLELSKVNDERLMLLKALIPKLTENELFDLAEYSESWDRLDISHYNYFNYLKRLCIRKGIGLEQFPNLDLFNKYFYLTDKLKHNAILTEKRNLEELIEDTLCKTHNQKQLFCLLQDLNLLKGLFKLEVTNEEEEYYFSNKHKFSSKRFQKFIKSHQTKLFYNWDPKIKEIDKYLSTVEEFYSLARRRDEILIKNTLSKMSAGQIDKAVLIAGGGHTKGITRILRHKNLSYLVISPRIIHLEQTYWSILANIKTDFERILEKEIFQLIPPSPFKPLTHKEQKKILESQLVIYNKSRLIYEFKKKNLSNYEIKEKVEAKLSNWNEIDQKKVTFKYGSILTYKDTTYIPFKICGSDFTVIYKDPKIKLSHVISNLLESGDLSKNLQMFIIKDEDFKKVYYEYLIYDLKEAARMKDEDTLILSIWTGSVTPAAHIVDRERKIHSLKQEDTLKLQKLLVETSGYGGRDLPHIINTGWQEFYEDNSKWLLVKKGRRKPRLIIKSNETSYLYANLEKVPAIRDNFILYIASRDEKDPDYFETSAKDVVRKINNIPKISRDNVVFVIRLPKGINRAELRQWKKLIAELKDLIGNENVLFDPSKQKLDKFIHKKTPGKDIVFIEFTHTLKDGIICKGEVPYTSGDILQSGDLSHIKYLISGLGSCQLPMIEAGLLTAALRKKGVGVINNTTQAVDSETALMRFKALLQILKETDQFELPADYTNDLVDERLNLPPEKRNGGNSAKLRSLHS